MQIIHYSSGSSDCRKTTLSRSSTKARTRRLESRTSARTANIASRSGVWIVKLEPDRGLRCSPSEHSSRLLHRSRLHQLPRRLILASTPSNGSLHLANRPLRRGSPTDSKLSTAPSKKPSGTRYVQMHEIKENARNE